MTRNFSNQRRDGMRPSPRNSASDKNREEQASRSARPRLSRDAVDRAWENGATRTYADYRPRQNPPTSPAQRQGRPAPAYDRSRQPQNRRPYEPSQETHGSSHPSARPGGYQPRQQAEDGPRRFERPGYRAPGGQPGLNSERWTRNPAQQPSGGYSDRYEDRRPPRFQQDGPSSNYRGSQTSRPPRFQQGGPNPNYRSENRPPRFQQDGPNPNYRSENRPPRFQQDGPNPNYRSENRPPRFQQDGPNPNYRSENRPPRFQQDGPNPNYRSPNQPRSFERGQRNSRDSYNPRWQSRPGPQRDYAIEQREFAASQQEFADEGPGRAQFEGDYERFTDREHTGAPRPAQRSERPAPAYEKTVTRLPDGRVLKGSRPAQRRQATFWNGVESETSELISNVATPQEQSEPQTEAAPVPQKPISQKPAPRPARPRRPAAGIRRVKTVKASSTEDEKPRSAKVARKNAQGPQKPVTRPSRRGYKWPASGE